MRRFRKWMLAEGGDGGEEALGVGVLRVGAEGGGGAGLDELAVVEDEDFIADVFDDGEVVADEEVGEVEFFLEVLEEADDLGLDADVEGADGFVTDDEAGFDGEGAGDADALALAAGEFAGAAVEVVGVEADFLEEGGGAVSAVGGGAGGEVDFHGLGEGLEDGEAGVEGAEGVLEDHLDFAAEGEEGALVHGGDVDAAVEDASGGGGLELDEGAGDGGFSGAAFADEADGFSCWEGEADVVDGGDAAFFAAEEEAAHDGEGDGEVFDLEEGRRGHGGGAGGWRGF